MKHFNTVILLLFSIILFASYSMIMHTQSTRMDDEMLIRIAEIEIESKFLEEYKTILKDEAAASVRLESGVLCIYPMYQKDSPTKISLLEIYANQEAYEAHLRTEHFQHYKTSTLNMVKSLKLIDMEAIDKESMSKIFSKIP